MSAPRAVLLVTHTGRDDARAVARGVADALDRAGIEVRAPADEAAEIAHPALVPVDTGAPGAAAGCEVAVVLGGDGTILRACELVRADGVPILGVNLGHVGFLAEAERDDVSTVVEALVERRWSVEERLTLDVRVLRDGDQVASTWALNEASVEKTIRERMLELVVEVDGRPLSRWGADGVVCATPTGSTAYAFSAGGPVVWPEVEALVLVPISAHALFARPLVVSPAGVLAVEVLTGSAGVLWCDGRRSVELPAGSRVEVRRSLTPVRLARLHRAPFTDRLVAKFGLPVSGWRGDGPVIEEIRIRGLGVIEEAVLDLHPGFTVVTGETGAGKTMVLTGLGLLLGAKADAGAVRRGAERAEVDGAWQVDPAGVPAARTAEAGGTLEDGTLLVGRTLSAEGRSRAFLGGRAVPAAVLAQVVGELVAVHGQSDQHRLSAPSRQRELLDRFGGSDVLGPRERYRTAFAEWRAVEAELAALSAAGRERAREADQLRFGLGEVAGVQPQPGEDLTLAAESERLSHAEALVAGAHTARTSLASDGEVGELDVLGLVAAARRALEAVRAHDPVLGVAADRLAEVAVSLADIAADLASYEASVEADPARQEAVEQRRAQLGALTRKYGDTIAEVLVWSEQASGRLAELEGTDDRLDQLASRQISLRRELALAAGVLHTARAAAAGRLGAAVTAELVHLAMPHARVEVDVTPTAASGQDTLEVDIGGEVRHAAPGPQGIDEVEIRLAPHPGAELRPVAKGASGGELSRVMLALEVALAGTDPVPTFVFDEVDAGIGGRAAVEVGRRLARLARGSQVVVVTHLPQVAAFADRHLVVHKADDGSVTRSGIGAVEGDDRVRELARMLAGLEESDTGAAHARELLDLAAADRAEAGVPTSPRTARRVRTRPATSGKAAR